MHIDDVVELVRLEYSEQPALRLTEEQAQHLWDLPERQCGYAFSVLVRQRFLARTVDGAYVRRGVPPSRWVPAM
jgi:hypothetical protein